RGAAAQGDSRFHGSQPRTPPAKSPAPASAIVIPPPSIPARQLQDAAAEALALAGIVGWARDLGNTPGNDLGPSDLAREIRSAARRDGLRLRVLGKKEIERERMGGLLAVNAGSVRPPVFLIGEYRPRGARGTAVLVGEGVTFDSGRLTNTPASSPGETQLDII